MIIHDISRDTLTSPVYEGDPDTGGDAAEKH